MRKVSDEVKIPREEFGDNLLTGREYAEEEAARDLVKHPRQILADVHHESLTPRTDFVARTLARLASMQLRVQEEVEKQSKATEELNRKVATLTGVGVALGIIAAVLGTAQVIIGILALCK